jgi:tetratricopeptide (TPR) repeat protein
MEEVFKTKIDHQRLETLEPVEKAIEALKLPVLRFRKLNGILNALTMQIEDGGDNAEVNRLLAQALRAAILAQAGQEAGRAALEALARFEQTEAQRPPTTHAQPAAPLAPSDTKGMIAKINGLIEDGYGGPMTHNSLSACQPWLEAWELVKKLARPYIQSRAQFCRAYAAIDPQFDSYCYDLMYELHNAGLDDVHYQEERITYIREFLSIFPAENGDDDVVLSFGRGEGEALWELGRVAESEAVYTALVERLPDEGWAYIGWADQYWLMRDSPKEYARGEAILQRALQRPTLKDKNDALERLMELYDKWGKPVQARAIEQRLLQKAQPARSRPRHKKKKK